MDKVVARGLGKDNNVLAKATQIDKNINGKGQAQTIIMKKDSSKNSLHSARMSARGDNRGDHRGEQSNNFK